MSWEPRTVLATHRLPGPGHMLPSAEQLMYYTGLTTPTCSHPLHPKLAMADLQVAPGGTEVWAGTEYLLSIKGTGSPTASSPPAWLPEEKLLGCDLTAEHEVGLRAGRVQRAQEGALVQRNLMACLPLSMCLRCEKAWEPKIWSRAPVGRTLPKHSTDQGPADKTMQSFPVCKGACTEPLQSSCWLFPTIHLAVRTKLMSMTENCGIPGLIEMSTKHQAELTATGLVSSTGCVEAPGEQP